MTSLARGINSDIFPLATCVDSNKCRSIWMRVDRFSRVCVVLTVNQPQLSSVTFDKNCSSQSKRTNGFLFIFDSRVTARGSTKHCTES